MLTITEIMLENAGPRCPYATSRLQSDFFEFAASAASVLASASRSA